MAIWPFNRQKKNQTEVSMPAEVQQYYQAERRERVGLAWLLAAGTLVVTVLVVLGLFFGGRWIYRKVNESDNKPQTASQNNSSNKPPTTTAPSGSANPSQPTPSPTPQPTTPTPQSQTPTPPSGEVPRTGPDIDL